MASNPGILTDWPWTPLGNFKYLVVAPWVVEGAYRYLTVGKDEKDLTNLIILPLLLWRMVHNQIWISLARHRTAKGSNRILDRGIEFEQVDRETNWDDQILLNGILFYVLNKILPGASQLPMWRTDGVIIVALLHAGPVEFLYYWFHRALHHHFLYSRYHSHHHTSIVTQPITSVIHPFAELLVYYMLFSIPMVTAVLTGTASNGALLTYLTYLDFMNNMGHCNFELIPSWLFSFFPPLKYLMYTPSFHSLHHTQFRTNYSLFMPFYDYIYSTMDENSDALYHKALRRPAERPDAVHLTHLTTPQSLFQLRLGFGFFASQPDKNNDDKNNNTFLSRWYIRCVIWPMSVLWSFFRTSIGYSRPTSFVLERNRFYNLNLQIWAIPKFNLHYSMSGHRESINKLVEEAIVEADEMGVKVISLGLLNQGDELNRYGEMYVQRHPKLKIKILDGSSLAVAAVINSIPKGTTQIVLRGKLTKIAHAIVSILCQRRIKVVTLCSDELHSVQKSLGAILGSNLVLKTGSYSPTIWLVDDGLSEEEQMKAISGTFFIPYSPFPPTKFRKDCYYHTTPAMLSPKSIENIDSCENWLPRRVMSTWRVGGIVHALERWDDHECGNTISGVERAWQAALSHGFKPLSVPL